jgi:hypothetical protein
VGLGGRENTDADDDQERRGWNRRATRSTIPGVKGQRLINRLDCAVALRELRAVDSALPKDLGPSQHRQPFSIAGNKVVVQ